MDQAPLKAVILTALPIEFKEVRNFVTGAHRVNHPLGNVYERGTFQANGREWQVSIVETGTGDSKSALQTERAISFFEPDVVIFVGIAGGIKDVAIGDIVASTKIYGYESGKAEEEFKPRPEIGLSGFSFMEEAKAEVRSESAAWLSRLSSQPEPLPQLRVGPIAVGEKVIASTQSDVYKFLQRNYSDALAVEMEGYGFLEAVNARRKPLPAIVVRGISDLIDNKNDAVDQEPEDIRQQKASHHASAFAFQLLVSYDPHQSLTGSQSMLPKVAPQVWDELFSGFQAADLAFLKVALEGVLVPANKDYSLGQIDTLAALQVALARLDDLSLAVTWVGQIIQRCEAVPDDDAPFTISPALQTWYDTHKPSEPVPQAEAPPLGYLLVALGLVDDDDNVMLTAELHVEGEPPRTDFLPPGTKCSVDGVCDLLSDVIPMAGEVRAVEIFLPWQHLTQPVHDWKIWPSQRAQGRRNQKELWQIPRNTLVRSLDRLQDKLWSEEWLKGLKTRWKQLQNVEEILAEHTYCAECLTEELFEGALNQKLIFKFLVTLPADKDDLADLLYEVIESKVPIWLWVYRDPTNAIDLSTRVDTLLTPDNLRESASLAQAILDQRQDLRELGLLFDCPTRFPSLPALAINESGRLRQPAA